MEEGTNMITEKIGREREVGVVLELSSIVTRWSFGEQFRQMIESAGEVVIVDLSKLANFLLSEDVVRLITVLREEGIRRKIVLVAKEEQRSLLLATLHAWQLEKDISVFPDQLSARAFFGRKPIVQALIDVNWNP